MSMASDDITIEILKGIRDEIRGLREDTNGRLDKLNGRVDVVVERVDLVAERLEVTNQRLDVVETTLFDMVAQQGLAFRYLRTLAGRDRSLEPRVSDLELRVTKLESD